MKLLEALSGLIDAIFKPLNALFKKAQGPVRFDDRPPDKIPVGPTELKPLVVIGPSRPIDTRQRPDGLVSENPRELAEMYRMEERIAKGQ